MKKPAKTFILIACGFLLAIFFFPIWQIQLQAPQYPGHLDMYIWINKITGTDEFTLQNINILNHYIGMEAIYPDSFKELQIMPFVVAFFILTGILTAMINKRKVLIAWLSLLVVAGTVGLVDFYMWQQAFGNNLDPAAPIKVEGMSYSPPFIGSKTLLNIVAISFPSWGGIFFGAALLAGFSALIIDIKRKKKELLQKSLYTGGIAACLLFIITSCQPKAQAIEYGFDSCHHCKMTIADDRYGSEVVTKKGKVYKFDAIECMADYTKANPDEYAFELVTAFNNGGVFIDAQNAWYLQTKSLPSPMGMNLNAFRTEKEAKDFHQQHGGKILNWEAAKELNMHNIH